MPTFVKLLLAIAVLAAGVLAVGLFQERQSASFAVPGRLVSTSRFVAAEQVQNYSALEEWRGGPFGISDAAVYFTWRARLSWGYDFGSDWDFEPSLEDGVLTLSVPRLRLLSHDLLTDQFQARVVDEGIAVNEAEMIARYIVTMIDAGTADGIRMARDSLVVRTARASLRDHVRALMGGDGGSRDVREIRFRTVDRRPAEGGDTVAALIAGAPPRAILARAADADRDEVRRVLAGYRTRDGIDWERLEADLTRRSIP